MKSIGTELNNKRPIVIQTVPLLPIGDCMLENFSHDSYLINSVVLKVSNNTFEKKETDDLPLKRT